jgi:FMN phosphatase YigB (HAD superfamily)
MLTLPSGIQAVIFDVANTLLHKPALYASLNNLLQHQTAWAGMPEDIERVHRIASEVTEIPPRPTREFYNGFNARWLQALGIPPDGEILDAVFELARSSPWESFTDVSALEEIQLPIAVLSNWDSRLPAMLEKTLSANIRFQFVLASESIGFAKPDPAAFAAAIHSTGLPASNLLYVGDSPRLDMFPALAAGMHAILIDRSNFFPQYGETKTQSLFNLARLLSRPT